MSPTRALRTGLSALMLAAAGAGTLPAQQEPAPPSPPTIAIPPAFDAVLRGYETAWRNRDPRALAALFTEDGFVLRPGSPPVRGTEAIRAAYANAGGPLVLRAYGFAVDGTVGYIVGGFAREERDPDIGKFVLALREVPGRGWRIAADIDNGNTR